MRSAFRRTRRNHLRRYVRLVCSCDRYNYGDLLFPIVTARALKAVPELRDSFGVEPYGLLRSDLSPFGALPSRSMNDLYKDTRDGDVVLLAGGENLAQTWYVMCLTLLRTNLARKWARFRELIGTDLSECLSRRWLRGRQEFPYVLSPNQFAKGVRVMYNSVGGWPLAHYLPERQKAIARSLSQASYISVRDKVSASILGHLEPSVSTDVAPDSVFLLPELFSKNQLAARSSPQVQELVKAAGAFVCFQCNERYGEANREELKAQLRAIAQRENVKIILTPIGRMHSFEDGDFLSSLASDLKGYAHSLPKQAGIFDVAYTVAYSRLFCGTSLHGAITALAFGVPFVPLANEDPKLENNVASWGLEEMFPESAPFNLAVKASEALKLDRDVISSHAARLTEEARPNMSRRGSHILAA